jgi:transposase
MGSGLKYSPEFRVEAVRLVTEFSRSLVDVSAELGISKDTLRGWVRQARMEKMTVTEVDAAVESREMKILAKRVSELEMENAFLKKAAAFFAAEQVPKNGMRS